MQHKKIIFMFFLLLWMVLIFCFSNQSASVSEKNSDLVTEKVIDTVSTITKKDVTESKKKELIKNVRFFVRKTAHFTLYFILNFIVYFTFKTFHIKYSLFYSVVFCFLFACTDEIHQLFIDNRSGRFLDVFIDTSGAFVNSLLILFFRKYYKKS